MKRPLDPQEVIPALYRSMEATDAAVKAVGLDLDHTRLNLELRLEALERETEVLRRVVTALVATHLAPQDALKHLATDRTVTRAEVADSLRAYQRLLNR